MVPAVVVATVMTAVVTAVMSPSMAVTGAFPVAVAVMSATRAASAATAAGDRDQRGGVRARIGSGRRICAAISHGRCGGQRRPQQYGDGQQAPGTGSVHPGSMGPRAPARGGLGPGSPERVECSP
ncbi:hypothetical protein Sxan_34610 [Streptomyces xanthophaeus]|uniref:Secreted protein n=1 Tax=Streptomyces xanthophaeus TaxID=67385 RepID=A0A919GWB1_9ACTN|nr:hypothetical protein Sxan_34610 [Streptomyces xanthophaeus]